MTKTSIVLYEKEIRRELLNL